METILLAIFSLWLILGVFAIYRHQQRLKGITDRFTYLKQQHEDSVGIDSSARAYAEMLEYYNTNMGMLTLAAFRKEYPFAYWGRTLLLCLTFALPITVVSLYRALRP